MTLAGGVAATARDLAAAMAAAGGVLTNIAADAVKMIIEVKFKGDSLTDNQADALDKMSDADKEKYKEMTVEDACICN